LSECLAQVGVGFGQVGLDAKSLLELLDRLHGLTLLEERGAQLLRARAKSGLMRSACWKWLIASAGLPCWRSAAPQLLWARAKSGLRRSACWKWSIASAGLP